MSAWPEETSSEEGLICPYCGYVDYDAWELDTSGIDRETECGQCERPFDYSVETTVVYYGKPIKKEGA